MCLVEQSDRRSAGIRTVRLCGLWIYFPLGLKRQKNFLLTSNNAIGIVYLKNKHTTSEVAEIVGIHLATLQRWISQGKVHAPQPTLIGAVGYRLWSQGDITRLKELKKAIYCKGRGRKRKRKS